MNFRESIKSLILVPFLLSLLLVYSCGCAIRPQATSGSDKMISQGMGDYPALTIEELTKQAEIIVRGTVVSRGELFEMKMSETLVFLATPITIQVTEWIKGENGTDTIIYNELGGKTETHVMDTVPHPLVKGEDVIICLSANGLGWGPAAVFIINDNKLDVQNYQLPESAYFKEGETASRISVSELIVEIRKWLE